MKKGRTVMSRKLSTEQQVELAKVLILMKVPKEKMRSMLLAIETEQEAKLFLQKLSENNYEMTPEEVYQASVDTILELQ